jgi:hypothetical protein
MKTAFLWNPFHQEFHLVSQNPAVSKQ